MFDTTVDPRTLRRIVSNRRGASFDYGRKRIGWAVCDEYHVTVTPKGTFLRDSPTLWDEIISALRREKIDFCVIGIPLRDDGTTTSLQREIITFARKMEKATSLPVILVDESFSSRRALATMVEIGVRRNQRRNRDRTDRVAAAVILRDFLEETR